MTIKEEQFWDNLPDCQKIYKVVNGKKEKVLTLSDESRYKINNNIIYNR